MEKIISTHQHVLEDGTIIKHSQLEEEMYDCEENQEHAFTHNHHGHIHTHQNTKAVLNRLSKAIGHMEAIKRMVENGRDCSEVLVQLAAVKSAINNTGKVILKDHIEHCIVDAIREEDTHALDELNKAIDRFMK